MFVTHTIHFLIFYFNDGKHIYHMVRYEDNFFVWQQIRPFNFPLFQLHPFFNQSFLLKVHIPRIIEETHRMVMLIVLFLFNILWSFDISGPLWLGRDCLSKDYLISRVSKCAPLQQPTHPVNKPFICKPGSQSSYLQPPPLCNSQIPIFALPQIIPGSGTKQLEATPLAQSLLKLFQLSNPKLDQTCPLYLTHFFPGKPQWRLWATLFPSCFLLLPEWTCYFPMWPCVPFSWELWVIKLCVSSLVTSIN